MCSPPHKAVAATESTIAQGTFRAASRVSSANWAGASYPASASHVSRISRTVLIPDMLKHLQTRVQAAVATTDTAAAARGVILEHRRHCWVSE